nr:MAG TPA: Putative minor capsid protein [Microviridae sp.]
MGLFDAIASTVGNLTDNVLGMVNQNHQNKVNLRMMREQNDFNAKQAEIQRDWQEEMWNKNNEYNSPEAMISRGLNPFIASSAGAGVSRSPASGGVAASAAPVPSMQAFRPNFSGVFESLATLAQAKASEASADESRSRTNQNNTVTPLLSDYYRGLTNWKNLAIGDSGYWNKTTGRISAALDQSTEAQNLKNAQFAERISAAQETQILLNSEAQRIINRYMDENQQADLFIKAQTLVNLQNQGALTEKQILTEIQRAILVSAEASGKNISNRIAADTADSLIKAANASYELQYRDSTYDFKNVKLRKHTEYKTSMAQQKAAEYGAELERKQSRTHYWESVSRGLGSIASGAGNFVGSLRPGANIYRNDYGPRNTTIYNGR